MSKQVDVSTRHHAVVIGASMGGLAAAAALAPFYQRVTILERDTLADQPRHRRGVPQSKHAHGLQPGGMRALDGLLPGVMDELVVVGVPTADLSQGCSWTVGGGRFARTVSGVPGIGVTRPLLEHQVRARVAALPGVAIRQHVEVVRLLASDPRRVTGVEVVLSDTDTTEQIAADLVVDAAGRCRSCRRG